MRSKKAFLGALAGLMVLAACDDNDGVVIVDPSNPGAPRDLVPTYEWVLDDFDGAAPVGHPTVKLTWLPPTDWNDEVFRVYGRRSSSSSYSLIATVTSCTTDGCVYVDNNVAAGTAYDYYVATTDEGRGGETSTEFAESITVPAYTRPGTPASPAAVALDGANYLRWSVPSGADNVSKYLVYLTEVDGEEYLYRVGETDGWGFLDEQAENGSEFGYRVAAVDTLGHVSNLSAQVFGVPRPDYHGELLYAFADNAAQSGFRFAADEGDNPVVSGSAADADFRLETGAQGWMLVPRNGAQVVEFSQRTTALTCGPGADAGCVAATVAPAAGYSTAPVAVDPEYTYILRVVRGNQVHYGAVRVQILGSDQTDRDLMIFDWSYQLLANEPRLNVAAAR